MPSIPTLNRTSKVPRPAAGSAIFVAMTGFVFRPEGSAADRSVREGERLRASDTAVQQHPAFFAEDGATGEELGELWNARFPGSPRPHA